MNLDPQDVERLLESAVPTDVSEPPMAAIRGGARRRRARRRGGIAMAGVAAGVVVAAVAIVPTLDGVRPGSLSADSRSVGGQMITHEDLVGQGEEWSASVPGEAALTAAQPSTEEPADAAARSQYAATAPAAPSADQVPSMSADANEPEAGPVLARVSARRLTLADACTAVALIQEPPLPAEPGPDVQPVTLSVEERAESGVSECGAALEELVAVADRVRQVRRLGGATLLYEDERGETLFVLDRAERGQGTRED